MQSLTLVLMPSLFARFHEVESPKVEFSSMEPFETGVDEQSVTILRNLADELPKVTLTYQAKMPKTESLLLELKAISYSRRISAG